MRGKSMKDKKNKTKIGFQKIAGAVRYTIKEGKKTKTFDVIKHKIQQN